MKRSDYQDHSFGQLAWDYLGHWPHGFFMPSAIRRDMDLSGITQSVVDDAQLALGKVAGLAMLIGEPEVLLAPTLAREALSSSRIEGTKASLSSVLGAEIEETNIREENLREVFNYLQALKVGTQLLETLPLASRLFLQMHKILLCGVRGEEKFPGELRTSPVWIGEPGARPEEAKYIPPLPSALPELLTDWERYVNEAPTSSVVVRAALTHYQFETIHPFLDGNGRIGRLLVSLLLIHDGVLDQPILNLSSYIERFKSEYYERLQAVREKGQMDEWVRFFAQGVRTQANETTVRLTRLVAIRAQYRKEAENDRTAIVSLIDVMFRHPILTVKKIQEELSTSQPTASKLLHRAQDLGWLSPLARKGRGGKRSWFAAEIWSATTDERVED
jgi:Fic family protein